MKVGDFAKYIHEDSAEDKATGFYPPIGTVGRVVEIYEKDHTIIVKWPKGTTTSGGGYVSTTDVEIIHMFNDEMHNGLYEYVKAHKDILTKDDLYRIVMHYDYASKNFFKHYVGVSEEDYHTIIDNMVNPEDVEFVDEICK